MTEQKPDPLFDVPQHQSAELPADEPQIVVEMIPAETDAKPAASNQPVDIKKNQLQVETQPKTDSPSPPHSKKSALLFFRLFFLLPPLLFMLLIALPGPLVASKSVFVSKGMHRHDIAEMLENQGAVWNGFAFLIVAKILAPANLQAGEYLFSPDISIIEAVMNMRDGKSVIHNFTVSEGLTVAEIAVMLEGEVVLTGSASPLPAEGRLLPETYHYNYGDNRQTILARMEKAERDLLADLWSKRDPQIPLKSPEEAVILASIVEKETGKKAEERARVAGVFYNRLRQAMRLQSDPTVIYALSNGRGNLGRGLTHEDMAFASPYNTYTNAGLPPTPICNPGKAALIATLHPEAHDYLYFVADGTGGHAFARDLAEHNRNVERWINLNNR